MKVIATKTGFDGKKVRVEGEEFEMPDGSKASWFVSVEKAKVKGQKPAKPEADEGSDNVADLT